MKIDRYAKSESFNCIFSTIIYCFTQLQYFYLYLSHAIKFKSHVKWNEKLQNNEGVSTLSHPCLHTAHGNTLVIGANFVVNCHKTRVNTLKS